ncbi:MAG: hypothetical protein GYB64_15855, partial [Chloroflexi bacterium]|nr:hypothetical protein [Chloroflexota bacterium]
MTPKPNNRSEIVSLLFAVGIALVAAAPLLLNAGFLNTRAGGDSPFLLMRVHQLTAGLRDGVFPVRWMPDAAYGLGYPFFNYYAALPYYFAALLRLLGFSTVVSLKIVQLMGFVVAALGMYGWVRRITERAWTAALAAAAYTVTPFHLVNVYVRGDSLSEFWAMAWYPLILLSLHAAAERPTARRIALVGLAFGALVMTHNVSALLFAPFVAVYAVGCGLAHRKEPAPRTLLGLAAGGVLGLALAAWVWLPALAETGFVQLDEQTTGFFFYGTHFRTADLVQPRLLFDYAPADNPFSMGLVQAVLTGLGTAATAVRMVREQSWWRDGFLLGGLALSTLMITPLSEPLWANLPLLPFAQFPWRFLSVQALFTAAVTAALVDLFAGRTARIAAAVAPALLIGAAGLGALRLDFIGITEADITPQRLQWYEAFTGNIGTTIRYEYLPRWTQPRPYSSDILMGQPPRAKFLSGTGTAERVAVGVHRQTWRISVGEDAAIGLPVLYFPGWQARADGQRVALSPV